MLLVALFTLTQGVNQGAGRGRLLCLKRNSQIAEIIFSVQGVVMM